MNRVRLFRGISLFFDLNNFYSLSMQIVVFSVNVDIVMICASGGNAQPRYRMKSGNNGLER